VDVEPFLEGVTQRPYDAAPKLVLADYLDETGDSAGARGMRGAVRCRWLPHDYSEFVGRRLWCWMKPVRGVGIQRRVGYLPRYLYAHLMSAELAGFYREYSTPQAAWLDFLVACRATKWPRPRRTTKTRQGD
jgi:uncharacterized protein (TIGR02996 family)